MEEYETTKYERDTFIGGNNYLRGQFYKKICVSTVGNKLTSLNITDLLPGKEDNFINYLEKSTEDLKELQQEPNTKC